MYLDDISLKTRELMAKATLESMHDPKLQKTINVATGLVGINLDAPAKQLVALMSPFNQSIPRITKPGAESSQFRRITALSQPKLSVAENAGGAVFATTLDTVVAAFKGMALGGQVSREAQAASKGFDDALAKETANTQLLFKKLEEMYMLGGNITALATPGAPTVTEIAAKGDLAADQYFVRIAAMTLPASNRVSIGRPVFDGTDHLLAGLAIAAFDVSTDGVTVSGAEGNVTTTGGGDAIKVTWTAIAGAAAYGVFVGLTTGAANLTLEAIVAQTNVTLTTLATGGVAGDHAGTSADALSYDGIIQQLVASGSGAFVNNVNANLTATAGSGEILEIADAFQSIWDNAKLGSFRLIVGGVDARLLTRKGISSDNIRLVVGPGDDGKSSLGFGQHIGRIMNPVTGDWADVETAPWMPGSTILILPKEIPYPMNNLNNSAFDMAMGFNDERWDYASTRATGPIFPFEIRNWGVIRGLFTGGCGILYNIHQG